MNEKMANQIAEMKKQTIAIATKGYKKVELKSWEQVMAYQNRGWKITMAK